MCLATRLVKNRRWQHFAAAFQSPIHYLDTAAGYGDGESERRIGLVLRELGGLPDGFVLATKVDRHATTGDFSGEQTRRSVERSLKLLGLDHLQMVFLHDPEVTTFENIMQPGGAVEVMLRYKEQGVIGHIGVAGGPIDLMIRYIETGAFEAVLTHNRYTLLNRAAEPLLQMATQRRIAILNAAPYGGGILSRGPENFPRYAYRDANAVTLQHAQQMRAICDEYHVPLAAAALQFSIRDARITSTVVGMTATRTHRPNARLVRTIRSPKSYGKSWKQWEVRRRICNTHLFKRTTL